MAGTIQADYLQPTSTAGLTILTPSGNTIASINTSGVFSTTGSLILSANGQILTSTYSSLTANTLQIGQSGSSSNNFTLYQPSTPDGTVRLGNGNIGSVTNLLTVNSSGNIGLGVTPSAWGSAWKSIQIGTVASLYQDNNANVLLGRNTYHNGTSNLYLINGYAQRIYMNASGEIIFNNAPSGTAGNAISFTQAMTLDASGNLGIGTTSPSQKIHAKDASAAFGRFESGSYDAYIGQRSTGNFELAQAQAGNITFLTNGSERARIDSSGNLLVGTTSAVLSGQITNTFSAASKNGMAFSETSGTTGATFIYFTINGTAIGNISRVTTTNAVAYNTSSDQRLKENIVDAPGALSSVNAIKVRSFDWKADGSHVDYGYIAQELLEIVPEAVSVPSDEEEMMGVDFGKLTPRLVKAFQEMYSELQDVKAELAALKSK